MARPPFSPTVEIQELYLKEEPVEIGNFPIPQKEPGKAIVAAIWQQRHLIRRETTGTLVTPAHACRLDRLLDSKNLRDISADAQLICGPWTISDHTIIDMLPDASFSRQARMAYIAQS
ncbi:hypothetical protein D5086_029640 [Populus alba]|uniref:Uncharacterized protein n=1 Tax=Populus alba TaxID=43335 RepID=A0ACC4AU86_POPAL